MKKKTLTGTYSYRYLMTMAINKTIDYNWVFNNIN